MFPPTYKSTYWSVHYLIYLRILASIYLSSLISRIRMHTSTSPCILPPHNRTHRHNCMHPRYHLRVRHTLPYIRTHTRTHTHNHLHVLQQELTFPWTRTHTCKHKRVVPNLQTHPRALAQPRTHTHARSHMHAKTRAHNLSKSYTNLRIRHSIGAHRYLESRTSTQANTTLCMLECAASSILTCTHTTNHVLFCVCRRHIESHSHIHAYTMSCALRTSCIHTCTIPHAYVYEQATHRHMYTTGHGDMLILFQNHMHTFARTYRTPLMLRIQLMRMCSLRCCTYVHHVNTLHVHAMR